MSLLSWGLVGLASLGAEDAPDLKKYAGEAFGKKITNREFAYHYKTAAIFTRSGKEDRTEEETRAEAWQNYVYLKEAKEMGFTISPEDLTSELKRLMALKNVEYGTENYHQIVRNQFQESPEDFERRIEDLMIVNRFLAEKSNPDVTVTESEMLQKFLNQYNSFESEYLLFEDRAEAEDFHARVKKNPRLWKDTWDEKKPLGQKGASWINIMSLEALIDLWKIPKDDAYRILSHKPGDFIVAEFIYGTGVFRLLNNRQADMADYTDKKQDYYRGMIKQIKERKLVKGYFDGLLERAQHRDYRAEDEERKKRDLLKTKDLIALETNHGIIHVKLFVDAAPLACENFIGLVEKEYFDGIIFHRVIKGFMIQSGDPTGTGRGGDSIWDIPFINETSEDLLFDRPGLLAMANSGANTNKSQFFITTRKALHLNGRHTIFGEVIAGYSVVKEIEGVETGKSDKPKDEQVIVKAYIGDLSEEAELRLAGEEEFEKAEEEEALTHDEKNQ